LVFELTVGYLAVFDIYQGTTFGSNSNYEEKFGKGGGTLFILLEKLPDFIRSQPLEFYFDNYFTGIPLINHLTSLNYGGTGTTGIRENRIPVDCPLKSTKECKKK